MNDYFHTNKTSLLQRKVSNEGRRSHRHQQERTESWVCRCEHQLNYGEGARRMKVLQTRRTYIIIVVYNIYQGLPRIILKSP